MKQFYVGIGALIEKEGEVLVLKRSPKKDVGAGMWEIITGRMEEDEHPEESVLREVEEEVGLEVEIIAPIDTGFFYRGDKNQPMVFIVFWCRFLAGDVKLSWEHTEYKWITLDEGIKEEDLSFYHETFRKVVKLKEHLPSDFSL